MTPSSVFQYTIPMVDRQYASALRSLRLAQHLSTRQAAKLIGIDHSMLVRYEQGQVRMMARVVVPMALAYDCTPLQVMAAAEQDLLRRIDGEETERRVRGGTHAI